MQLPQGLLLEAGADADIINADRSTPLHWAAKKGHVEVAGVLLRGRARRDVKNIWGKTPVQYARVGGHVGVRALLEEGTTREEMQRLHEAQARSCNGRAAAGGAIASAPLVAAALPPHVAAASPPLVAAASPAAIGPPIDRRS